MPEVYSPIQKDGKTAVFHLRLQEPTVTVRGTVYKFELRAGVSLAWINDADLEDVLLISETCCGNRTKHNLLLANNRQVDVWEHAVR